MDKPMEETQWPVVLRNLFTPRADIETILKDLPWKPFRDGVRIAALYGNQTDGPSAALLHYTAGAGITRHEHDGYEHIFVLSENQQDERGVYPAGTLVINQPGSSHTVQNKNGGIVLVIRTKPARFP